MKILLLSDAQSVHTKRWISSLKLKGLDIVLFSIKPSLDDFYQNLHIKAYYFDLFTYKTSKSKFKALSKHIQAVRYLKTVLSIEKPDILHAHYVTSYAFIAALSGFKPLIVSAWGSDIYEFPKIRLINSLLVKYVLNKADRILSTSHVMAKEIGKYTNKDVIITPFGVDTDLFSPNKTHKTRFSIGTVKSLSPKYGIDLLIKTFKIVKDNNPNLDLYLEIAGKGPQEPTLKELAKNLDLENHVNFIGYIDNSLVASVYNQLDIAVFLSLSESFGVSAVEAMSCECPVVASDAEGFTEVIDNGVSGIIVPKNDPYSAAKAIQQLIDQPELAQVMGKNGRHRVIKHYDWNDNVNTMISVYNSI